ncbi:MAG: cytochrome c [Candidatus Paceibacterota bacterium]
MSKTGQERSRWVPIVFLIGMIALVAFWVLLFSTIVVHKTYTGGEATAEGGRPESIWAWLLIAALGWALVNLYWSLKAARKASEMGYLGHFAITIGCGLIAIGIQAVMVTRSLTMQPLVLDYSNANGTREAAPAAPAANSVTIAGDPEEGQKLFATTCVTCHGPTGQGIPNLAPSLVGSEFIASVDDAAVADVIRRGRAVGDPNNKSGKVMPARGGNPFLAEDQIAHLTAYVRSIQDGDVTVPGGDDAPAVQLARWVVPAATNPPSGIDVRILETEKNGGQSRVEQLAERRRTLMRRLTLGLTSVHGAFLLGVVVLSSNLLLPRLLTGRREVDPLLSKISVGGWAIAAAAWMFVASFCFWWS